MSPRAISRRVAFAVLSVLALAACGAADGENATATSGPAAAGLEAYDKVMGDVNAPVTLIEYASITCPHCATFHSDVLPTIKADYVDTGKVRYVFRDFPTPPANIAVAGFAIARCQGDQYFDVLDDLFANQAGILSAARSGAAKGALLAVAQRHGMKDEAELDACLANADIRREIADVVGLGEQNGVSSTPSIFVNGRQLGRSEEWYTPTGLAAILDAELGVEPAAAPAEDAASESGDAPAQEETEAEAPADTEAE